VPQLEARAKVLNGDLSRLAALRSQILRRRAEFTDALAALDHDRGTIDGLILRKVDLERRARVRGRAAETRATKLAAQARDLGDLVDRLARANRRANKERRTLLARRRPPYRAIPGTGSTTDAVSIVPARGRIVRRFGQSDGSGGDTKGITIETRPAAQVVAPREGEVVFAGPFRGYGQLLIIAYGGGYHVLLAGMSRIDAAVGDKVLAGEPVGGMNSSSDAKPSLYLELRREGRPINPLPWLAASRSKVSG
jgi:septal ring factor EnvC (AmiA/AmiB activator)